MLACVVLKVVAAASSGAEASSVFNTGYYRKLGRGAPRGGRAGSRRRGFDCRGRDKAMGVGSGASWDKGVLLVCARCSRRGGAARTGLGVRARRQYKQMGFMTMYRTREQQQGRTGPSTSRPPWPLRRRPRPRRPTWFPSVLRVVEAGVLILPGDAQEPRGLERAKSAHRRADPREDDEDAREGRREGARGLAEKRPAQSSLRSP